MHALFLAAWFVLLAAGRIAAKDALTGTWSPDRQIAVARELTGAGKWRCYFRDQRTGANLGDVPLHDPPPAGSEVLMRAAWNFPGTRVVLLIHYGWNAEELRFFSKDADGRLQPALFTKPDPVHLYRQQKGQPRPKMSGDYAEAGLGPWTDDDTINLFLGEARPNARKYRYIHFYAGFKVRFHGQRADLTNLHLKGPRMIDWGSNYCRTEWNAFGQAPEPATTLVEPRADDNGKETASADRVIVSHDSIAEDSAAGYALQDSCDEYRTDFGYFPSGDNREIMRQLLGLNPNKKAYALLDTFVLDRSGNVVDPWNEPFIFDLNGEHAHVFSRRREMTMAEHKNGRQWPAVYDPLYYPNKEEQARRICYQLALGIRLAVQRDGRVPTPKKLRHALFDSPADHSYPIIGLGGKIPRNVLDDPWGKPYRTELTADYVSVSSTRLPAEVCTELFTTVP